MTDTILIGFRNNLRRLHDPRPGRIEILRRRPIHSACDVERPRAIGRVYNIAIWHVQQPSARRQLASFQRLSTGSGGDLRRYSESYIHEKQKVVRVLGARNGSWHSRESKALDTAEHDVSVSPAGHGVAVTLNGPTASLASARRRNFSSQLTLQNLAFDSQIRLCAAFRVV